MTRSATFDVRKAVANLYPLKASIFPPPPRDPVLAWFEDNWRILLDVLFTVVSIVLVPLTGGLSFVARTAVNVGVEILFAATDTILDSVQGIGNPLNSFLNFLPVGLAGVGAAAKAAITSSRAAKSAAKLAGAVKASGRTEDFVRIAGAAARGEDLTKYVGLIADLDLQRLNIGKAGIRIPVDRYVGSFANHVGDIKIDDVTLALAGKTRSNRKVILQAFDTQVANNPAFAAKWNLDYGSYRNTVNWIRRDLARNAKQYFDAVDAIRAARASVSKAVEPTAFAKALREVRTHYRTVKRTVGRIKRLFEIPSLLIRRSFAYAGKQIRTALVKRFPKTAKIVGGIEKRAAKYLRPGLTKPEAKSRTPKAGRPKEYLEASGKYGRRLVSELDMIPVDSQWILGVRFVPKSNLKYAKLENIVRIAELGQIPDDPSWWADMWVFFNPATTAHNGKLAGQPHALWGIVGRKEPGGKRAVKIWINGPQARDALGWFSFGHWYYHYGRNLASRTYGVNQAARAIGSLAPVAALAGSSLPKWLTALSRTYSVAYKGLHEALYWRSQVQFVYTRARQIQDGTFFSKIIAPGKLRSIAQRSLVSELVKKSSIGNILYRVGYNAYLGNRAVLVTAYLKTLHGGNRDQARNWRRIRGQVYTGRRVQNYLFKGRLTYRNSPGARRKF